MTLRRTVLKISAPPVDDHPAADRSLCTNNCSPSGLVPCRSR
jgi:hypothetical protein